MPKKDRSAMGVKKHGIAGPKSPTGVAMEKPGKSGALDGGEGGLVEGLDRMAIETQKPKDGKEWIDGYPDFD